MNGGMSIKEIGQIIKNKRIENKISLKTLSEITNISISELSRIENGKVYNPNSVFLYRICNILKIDYNLLLRYKWEIFPICK